MTTYRFVPLSFVMASLTVSLHASAIADSNFSFDLQFPLTTVNQFGFSGATLSTSPPFTSTTGDGVIKQAAPSVLNTLSVVPYIADVTAGPLDVETSDLGTAFASENGDISGRLANLSSAPITVTFDLTISGGTFTLVDCDTCDFADASIFANFQIGNWTGSYQNTSSQNGPSMESGFTGGQVQVTIPASSVVPYFMSWTLQSDAFSNNPTPPPPPPPPPPTPEPATLVLIPAGLAALIWRRTSHSVTSSKHPDF